VGAASWQPFLGQDCLGDVTGIIITQVLSRIMLGVYALRDFIISWILGLAMMLGGGFFVYSQLKEIIEHVKKYRDEKAENKLRWWYFEWTFILWGVLLGAFVRPSLIISLILCLCGTGITVVEIRETIRIVAS
jgi:hypothetical protein